MGPAGRGSPGVGTVIVPVPRRSQSAETSGQASRMRRIVSSVMVASWESCRFRRFWVAESLASEFSVHFHSLLITAIRLRTSFSVISISRITSYYYLKKSKIFESYPKMSIFAVGLEYPLNQIQEKLPGNFPSYLFTNNKDTAVFLYLQAVGLGYSLELIARCLQVGDKDRRRTASTRSKSGCGPSNCSSKATTASRSPG